MSPIAQCGVSCKMTNVNAVARFRSYVDTESGPVHATLGTRCHPWVGGKRRSDARYGCFWFDGRSVPAHVFALELKLGRRLDPGMEACHTCDNEPCCNPDHLYEGTHAQNMQDMAAAGRANTAPANAMLAAHPELHARGERSGPAKLTTNDVRRIRDMHAKGSTQNDLANIFKVRQATVSYIVRRVTWREVS